MIFGIFFDKASFSWILGKWSGKEAALFVFRTYQELVSLNLNHCSVSWSAPSKARNPVLKGWTDALKMFSK